eukprot:14593828-Alexandrium_andersonii.AAC.1
MNASGQKPSGRTQQTRAAGLRQCDNKGISGASAKAQSAAAVRVRLLPRPHHERFGGGQAVPDGPPAEGGP